MLQQTQVPRVLVKYAEFLSAFPTAHALAQASLGDVLRAWQGLGYNRRAKLLHECAKAVVARHHGTFPETYEALVALPGVGPYTAGAVLAFAFNVPHAIIETNIRTIYLHYFFKDRTDVSDTELMPYIERTLDRRNPRSWYAALMDYGTHLKQTVGNENQRSRHYAKQSTFSGSARQLRGAVLRLLANRSANEPEIIAALHAFPAADIRAQLAALTAEGMIVLRRTRYTLP